MRKGSQWEREAKEILRKDFKTNIVFHLVNYEHVDFVVIEKLGKINLVEAKKSSKGFYYTKDMEKKRDQLLEYFKMAENLRGMGFECEVWIYVKFTMGRGQKSVIVKDKLESYEKIPVKYKC